MMYFMLIRTETFFKNRYPDFACMVAFLMFATMVFSWIYGSHFIMHEPFIFAMMYVWCKLEPEVMVQLYFIPVQSANLPWVLMLLSVITGGDPFKDLIGIASGHLYIYLTLVLPNTHGYNLLKTPRLFHKLIDMMEKYANGGRAPSNVRGFFGNNSGNSGRLD